MWWPADLKSSPPPSATRGEEMSQMQAQVCLTPKPFVPFPSVSLRPSSPLPLPLPLTSSLHFPLPLCLSKALSFPLGHGPLTQSLYLALAAFAACIGNAIGSASFPF